MGVTKRSIFIFRRDFRIIDNIGLTAACKASDVVIPIFIFTPEQIENEKNSFKSSNAVQFMIESLKDLDEKMENKLNLMYGNYIDVIEHMKEKHGINGVYANTNYSPYAKKRDKDIKKWCKANEVDFNVFHDIMLLPPGTALKKDGTHYKKFTPFYNECLQHKPDLLLRPLKKKYINFEKLEKDEMMIDFKKTDEFYIPNEKAFVHGGRDHAEKILSEYNVKTYDKVRDSMPDQKTTCLSAYLKFGLVSVREVYHHWHAQGGVELVRQLYWRDFWIQLGHYNPHVIGASLKPNYDAIKWVEDDELFEAWCEGRTGYPVVDAAMMQMNTTGYMHNRARMFTSNFLIKILGIDWRKGEKYFATKLIDYDMLVNNGNWQWSSSTGADSQPYFRIFNPWNQSSKFDKDAVYIKRYLPNLKGVAPSHLHDWEKGHRNYNLKKLNYVKPCCDYKKCRDRTLNMYKTALDQATK